MEPIAITGIGCRFPGGIHCPQSYWEALCEGRDAITEVPTDRWDVRAFYHPDRDQAGRVYTRKGGFLEGIDQFTPEFFGISPREADFVDPQQRLLLEITWEALEDAGLPPESLAGARVGVFVGLFMHDYENIHFGASERRLLGPHSATGPSTTIAANRISYVYDFRGPSVVVDTACSSSLVAVHLACQSIRNGESEVALAGGVNVLLNPEMTMVLCRGSFLSPDGYCKSFDARADGYTRAEGVGVIVLKRLSQALSDGDPIYALIRGSAVNQDGHSDGLTVPSVSAQVDVVQAALRNADVPPEAVQYVEAHGTGTAVGDPTEARALGTVLSPNRGDGDRCIIGSVKSNFGHTESAAGVAGLIKTALMLKHRQVPPNLHFETPNPKIPFKELKLRVPVALEPWPDGSGKPRIAGVNSFGFGGTNAHVVLQEAEATHGKIGGLEIPEGKGVLVPLSAHSPEALQAVAGAYLEYLREDQPERDLTLLDIGYTASLRRGHHAHRLTVVAHSLGTFEQHLQAFLAGENRHETPSGRIRRDASFKLAFVFSGMGQQWWRMGRHLLEEEPVFREAVEGCDALFRQHTESWFLLEELCKDEAHSPVNKTEIAQPCIFSVQVALAALWRSWGVVPDAITGHSVGEIAAAHVAGVLSLEDAVRVCFHRSRLQQQRAGLGGMLAVGLSLEETETLLQAFPGDVSVAAVNSPTSLTLSGNMEILEEIAGLLEEEKVFARFLRVEVPYHSPAMDAILPEFRTCLADIVPRPVDIPLISTVTGKAVAGPEIDADYWLQNVRAPVRFDAALHELIGTDHNVFIEMSAHPVLAASIGECLSATKKEAVVLPSLRRKEPEDVTMLSAAGQLYAVGYPIDWHCFYPNGGRLVTLPSYPWERESYWVETEASKQMRLGQRAQAGSALMGQRVHPLLGSKLETTVPTWNADIDLRDLAYLSDHVVQGSVVYPGAAYLEMALAAAREIFGDAPCAVRDVEIKAPFLLSEDESSTLQFLIDGEGKFSIHSKSAGDGQSWVLHATGDLERVDTQAGRDMVSFEEIRSRCCEEIPGAACYKQFGLRGIDYGPCFQGIERVWLGKDEALGRLSIPDAVAPEMDAYRLHPAILDACFQVLAAAPSEATYLPVKVEAIRVYGRPEDACWCHARLVEGTPNRIVGDIRLMDDSGNILAEVQHLHCRRMEDARASGGETLDGLLYEYVWKRQPRFEQSAQIKTADHLPSPRYVFEQLQPEAARLAGEYAREHYYAVVEPELDGLCLQYIISALSKLGFGFDRGDTFVADELAETLGIAPRHHQLLARFLGFLAEEGILAISEGQWKVLRQPEVEDPQRIWRELLQAHPDYQTELILTDRCGSRLKEVLCDEEDPLALIFPPGASFAEYLYRDAPTFRIYNRLMQRVIGRVLQNLPEGQPLRILEIGAGTGAMASYVIPLLSADRAEYVFTDVSQAFTASAEQRFRDLGFVTCQVLDIERDPLQQGFDPHTFDLILASDVLHATADLKATLQNVKRLLAFDGMLLMLEATHSPRWFDLVFGMLEGWWLFSDRDVRPAHATLPEQGWIDLLKTTGFSEVSAVSDLVDGREPLHSLIAARGPHVPVAVGQAGVVERKVPAVSQTNTHRPCLVFSSDQVLSDQLTGGLEEKGVAPVLLTEGETFGSNSGGFEIRRGHPEDLRRVLDTGCPNATASPIVIYLGEDAHENMTCATLAKTVNGECCQVLHLTQALMTRDWETPPDLWLVTTGTQMIDGAPDLSLSQTPLWGLGRVSATEYAKMHTRMVDLSPTPSVDELRSLCEEVLSPDHEDEIALRGNHRYVHRMVRTHFGNAGEPPTVPYALARTSSRGFEGLAFRETARRKPGPDEVEVEVCAAGINFKDVAKVTGILDDTSLADSGLLANLGLECSGVIVDIGKDVEGFEVGDEVMGLVLNCFASYATTDPRALVRKPSLLSFEEAATVSLAFMASYHALCELAKIQEGERVLIHTATGGVGLAAIQVARAAGAEILATAGTPEKRTFLKAMGIGYVGDSRSLAFADEILAYTDGEGVDVVLNTLPGKAIEKSMGLLKPMDGRFVDISNIYERTLTLYPPERGISFFSFDLEGVLCHDVSRAGFLLENVISHFDSGDYHPLPYRVFPIAGITHAFRSMREGRHIGKVVLSLGQNTGVVPVPVREKMDLCPDATYLISGGLGGVGLVVAKWLVSCGARHLVLLGRGGASSPEAVKTVEDLRATGVDVVVERVDVTQENQVEDLMVHIDRSMPPLRGIIHAAMVLDDAPLMQMDASQMEKVLAPKVLGAWNLHVGSLDKHLDFFICFSSVASLVGNAHQGNYAAANMFLDSLAHYRQAHGLPALTLCWGPIADVGYVAERESVRVFIERMGIYEVSLRQVWQAIVYGIEASLVQVGVMPVNWNTLSKNSISVANSPRFSALVQAVVGEEGRADDRSQDLMLSASPEERKQALTESLIGEVAGVLGISRSKLDLESPLNGLGFDSLMAVELVARIEEITDIALPRMTLLQGGLSVSRLVEVVEKELPEGHAVSPAQGVGNLPVDVDNLSEAEVDAMLRDMLSDEQEEST